MKLLAKLSASEIAVLKDIISDMKLFGSIRIKDLIQDLKLQGTESVYFEPMSKFFSHLFGNYSQTTLIENDLWIGNGINLTTNPRAIALFYAMDPNTDWQNILQDANQPNPPLTPMQINTLLCLSLIGASNSVGSFEGYLPLLDAVLREYDYHAFTFNQLAGFSALLCLKNLQIPSNLETTVSLMLDNDNDLFPLETIIDYSNDAQDIETQNQLLRIAAVFHARNETSDLDVYLTQRQLGRITFANPNQVITIENGPVKHGIPIGDDQENNFIGYPNITVLPNLNPESTHIDDASIFGTPHADDFAMITPNGKGLGLALYGGLGRDTFNFDFSCPYGGTPSSVFLGGNGDFNIYRLLNMDYSCGLFATIYNPDNEGQIIIETNSIYGDEAAFSGPIVDWKFTPTGGSGYDVTQTIEDDQSTTLSFTTSQSKLNIISYKRCQFGIWPNAQSHNLDTIAISSSAITAAGNVALCPYADNKVKLYKMNGDFFNTVPLLPQGASWADVFLSSSEDNKFHILGIQNSSGGNLTYTILDPSDGSKQNYFIDNNVKLSAFQITSTDSSKSEFASVYVKPDSVIRNSAPTSFGMYVYIPQIGAKRIDTIPSEYANDPDFDIYAGPTEKGFLINSIRTINYPIGDCRSFTYEMTSTGDIINNSTLNGVIHKVSPIKNGYFQVYTNNGVLYTQTYQNGIWSQAYPLENIFACNHAFLRDDILLQRLKNDMTLLLSGVGGYVFGPDNKNIMGPFELGDDTSQNVFAWGSGTLSPEGDTFISYNRVPSKTTVLSLPTSCLASNLIRDGRSCAKKVIKNIMKIVPEASTHVNKDAQLALADTPPSDTKFMFDYGKWSDVIEEHPETHQPIFTYDVFLDEQKVGSAKFYGQRMLCRNEEGTRHNLILATGELEQFKITPDMSIEKVCDTLPPPFFETVLFSAKAGTENGLLVGGSNVIGFTLRSMGVTKDTSHYLSKVVYYTGYFTMSFSKYVEKVGFKNDPHEYLDPLYQALIDTGNLWLMRTGADLVSIMLAKASNVLETHQWKRLAYATSKVGNCLKFGLFAYSATQSGVIPTAAAVASGTLAQMSVEKVGEHINKKYLSPK